MARLGNLQLEQFRELAGLGPTRSYLRESAAGYESEKPVGPSAKGGGGGASMPIPSSNTKPAPATRAQRDWTSIRSMTRSMPEPEPDPELDEDSEAELEEIMGRYMKEMASAIDDIDDSTAKKKMAALKAQIWKLHLAAVDLTVSYG